MRLVLQLEFPADARLLPRTRRALEGYLEGVGTPEEQRFDVVLALDEACVNVIRHAFPADGDGSIRVAAEITDTDVTVQVEDDGVGFDPFAVALRPVAPEDTSGRGLHIIRQVMTHVELESPTETGGTRVLMHKVLSGPASPPSPD